MSSLRYAVAGVFLLPALCTGVLAQDTYTQSASAERRAPAETKPAMDQEASNGRERATDAVGTTAEGSTKKMQDRDIESAVETELHHDILLSLDDVDVRVDRGAATLKGTVASVTARRRAAEIAETVKGVTEVVNQLTVRPHAHRSAYDLEQAITQALVASPATESFEVHINAEPNGSVRLSGRVDSWAERELVERLAESVAGVTNVTNDVEVEFTAARLDSEIAAEIERMLQWDAYIGDGQIDVRVRDGVVELSGSVDSAAEKSRATRIAWTTGTKDVDAEGLQVAVGGADGIGKQSGRLSDAEIAQAVELRLQADPYAPAAPIDAQVDEGVVTLNGVLETLKAKRSAISIATQTTGVKHVRDRLRVRPGGAIPTDQELKRRIDDALAVNTITEAYEISVDVNRGAVTLTGQVDNWFEKGAADDVAASVRGVRDVKNELRVVDATDRLAFDPYVDAWSIYDFDWYQPAPITVWKLDSTLKQEIENELWWSPFVDANEVNVTVENGVATLTGAVDSFAEASAAQENAFEGGAAGVVNQLRIQG